MTGQVRRVLATIKSWWSRTSTAVLGLLSEAASVVRTVAVRVVGAASAALVAIRERHRARMSRHVSHRTAIATRLSALLVTITPQPAIAAALAVLVSKHLGGPRASAEQRAYGFDDGQDGYESYYARRASSTPSRQPQRLWDR